MHSGEKPYQCDYCDKRFFEKHNMKQHMKVHTKQIDSAKQSNLAQSGTVQNNPVLSDSVHCDSVHSNTLQSTGQSDLGQHDLGQSDLGQSDLGQHDLGESHPLLVHEPMQAAMHSAGLDHLASVMRGHHTGLGNAPPGVATLQASHYQIDLRHVTS